jgi:RNA polymerase sigma-70 factor (ECF subfamily)
MPKDPAAFTRCFIRCRGMISSYILSLVRDPAAAEDLLQDVAVNLLEKFDAFDGRDFGAWARQVARWHVLNHWRSESRYRRTLRASTLDLLDAPFGAAEDRSAAWEVRKSALSRCLEGIGERLRGALEMRYVGGLSLAQIAARLGKREGAVQMAMARTRDRLADCVRRSLSVQVSDP